MGFTGLFVEVHCNPYEALSDAEQQLTPQQFKAMVNRLTFRQNQHEDEQLEQMRRLIDECDQELIDVLKRRLNIAAEIGRHKRSNKMPVVQASRYNQVLNERIEWAIRQGIDGQFMRAIMQLVHDEAVKVQLSNE